MPETCISGEEESGRKGLSSREFQKAEVLVLDLVIKGRELGPRYYEVYW